MSQSPSEQLRQDLETLRSVVGTELPFDRTDASGFVAIGISALVPAIVCFAGVRSPAALLGSATPFLVVLAVCLVRGYRSTHPSKRCPASKRREYRPGIWFMLALFSMLCGYVWWATSLGTPAAVANGTVLMFLGIIVALGAFYEPKRSASLCAAIPAIVMGLLWPHLDYFRFWTLLWSAVGLGAIAAGMLMHRQIAQQEIEAGSEGILDAAD